MHTVEALLSALECCGVDNARIEIEGGGEVPTLDGSAMVPSIFHLLPAYPIGEKWHASHQIAPVLAISNVIMKAAQGQAGHCQYLHLDCGLGAC